MVDSKPLSELISLKDPRLRREAYRRKWGPVECWLVTEGLSRCTWRKDHCFHHDGVLFAIGYNAASNPSVWDNGYGGQPGLAVSV